jgi:hypothetical protein
LSFFLALRQIILTLNEVVKLSKKSQKNMSLRFNGLDDGRFGSARSDPFTSANFGAESGSYYLRSAPLTFKEYELDQDPRAPPNVQSLKPVAEKPMNDLKANGASSHKQNRKTKKRGAQVRNNAQVNNVTTSTVANAPGERLVDSLGTATPVNKCASLSWDNFPSCTVRETYGFVKDSIQYARGTTEYPSFWSVLTYNQRYLYVLLSVLFAYLLYRILRKC